MKINENRAHTLFQKVIIILVFFISTKAPADTDLWWHLRAGQTMWEQHKILLTDSFSYTRLGALWVNAFWVSDIMFYLIYKIGGYLSLTVCVSLIGALTFYIVQRRSSAHPFLNNFAIVLAAITAAPIWGARPQVISFLFVALLDYWLSNNHKKWLVVPLFVLWVNLHGGWIWGFLLLVAHIAGLTAKIIFNNVQERNILWKEIQSLLAWTAISAFAIGCNPNGLSIWKLPFEQVNVSMQIQEWLSPDFHIFAFHPFLWMLFLLILLSPFQSRPTEWTQIFKVIGFAYLTFVAQRNIALFAIVAAPLLADWLNATMYSFFMEKRVNPKSTTLPLKFTIIFNNLIIATLSIFVIGYIFWVSRITEIEKSYPREAVQWIKNNQPEGRLFNSYNWGGYILWNLQNYPVFVDGRADLYGNEIISQWQSVITDQDSALAILDKWDINIVFIENSSPVITTLKENGWRVVFYDETSIILLRD